MCLCCYEWDQCSILHVSCAGHSIKSAVKMLAQCYCLQSQSRTDIEVTLFGGFSEWPSNPKPDADLTPIANTTVLRFGECIYLMHVCCIVMS